MNDKVETTPAAIEPEGGVRFRPFTEDADAEGHAAKAGRATEDAPEAEGAYRPGRATDDTDTEGHMPFRRGVTEPTGIEPEGSVRHPEPPPATGEADVEAHVIKVTEDAAISPEGAVRGRPFTEGDDDAAGIEPDGAARSGR
jgi:hypothetical protein